MTINIDKHLRTTLRQHVLINVVLNTLIKRFKNVVASTTYLSQSGTTQTNERKGVPTTHPLTFKIKAWI